jgi:hypothetical protein
MGPVRRPNIEQIGGGGPEATAFFRDLFLASHSGERVFVHGAVIITYLQGCRPLFRHATEYWNRESPREEGLCRAVRSS